LGGVVTVKLTLGPVLVVVEVVLLETTPLESTPAMVNVYVLAGVTPLGVVVEFGLVFPQPGVRTNVPHNTNNAITIHAPRMRFPPAAVPKATRPSRGSESQSPNPNPVLLLRAPVVIGPKVVMFKVALADVVPFSFRLVSPLG
jgi:hypothetical protein